MKCSKEIADKVYEFQKHKAEAEKLYEEIKHILKMNMMRRDSANHLLQINRRARNNTAMNIVINIIPLSLGSMARFFCFAGVSFPFHRLSL